MREVFHTEGLFTAHDINDLLLSLNVDESYLLMLTFKPCELKDDLDCASDAELEEYLDYNYIYFSPVINFIDME